MTPKKQVSPAIRILRGERDASARATHLEAATRKFLVTTNERKYMSTKTNFKRIALVAAAALGLGVLSSVPSQATVINAITITTAAGTASAAKADSTTAGSVTVKWQSITASDSVVLSATLKSKPTAATAPSVVLSGKDTLTAVAATVLAPGTVNTGFDGGNTPGVDGVTNGYLYNYKDSAVATSAVGYNSATFRVQLDSLTSTTRSSGTYVYTITATPYTYVAGIGVSPTFAGNNTIDYSKSVSADITITIAELASESVVASGTSSAWLTTTAANTSAAADTTPSVPAAVSATNTPRAYVYVKLLNAAGSAASESVTVTTTIGQVGSSTVRGKSVVLATSSGVVDIGVYSDGTAGTATITVASTSVTFSSKTVVFYAAAPTTIVASGLDIYPKIGTNTGALGVIAKDVNGNIFGGDLYVSSDALTVISETATACSFNSTAQRHQCDLTGVVEGKANITVRSAATTPSTGMVSSNAVAFTVQNKAADSFKLTWDKTTYAPGEKATLTLSVLASDGLPVSTSVGTIANLFSSKGIVLSTQAGAGSNTMFTGTVVVTAAPAAPAKTVTNTQTKTTPIVEYTVYMPTNGGTITAEATGGASLPLAKQVKVTASATITDNAAAALAAVTALATTVASLKTLITTLTNLVLKIQKKVKA